MRLSTGSEGILVGIADFVKRYRARRIATVVFCRNSATMIQSEGIQGKVMVNTV